MLIRPARLDEVPALNALIARSARALSRGYYTEAETEALVAHVFGVDSQLIHDGSYFVVERNAAFLACGGWSDRRTMSAEDPRLDPSCESARIRAFFVDPSCARSGIGRALLSHAEDAARAKGFHRASLMATLPVGHRMPDATTVAFVRMERSL